MSRKSLPSVYLVGPRACGKTSLGRLAAERLGVPFVDLDEAVVARAGRSIAEVVAVAGWEAFRDLESAALDEAARGVPAVVATGGGAVLREANRRRLRDTGRVVYLRTKAEVLAARLAADPLEAQRPSLTGGSVAEEVAAVLAEREPLYREVAHLELDAARPLPELVAELAAALAQDEAS